MSKFDKSLKECRVIIDGCSGHVYGDIHLIKETLNYGKELENENMMLKTKLAMYEELLENDLKLENKLAHVDYYGGDEALELLDKQQELREQIKSLDKKCDGECGIWLNLMKNYINIH